MKVDVQSLLKNLPEFAILHPVFDYIDCESPWFLCVDSIFNKPYSTETT